MNFVNNLIIKIKRNKVEFFLLLLILIIASILRFYNIVDFLHFANDEARDAFVVKNIFNKGSIPLLGPETSIGHFYLGPIFYYLLIPFFLIFKFHPVSGAILSAILGIISVFLMWKLTRNIFSKEAALISSFLYSISFIVILHSRWSWNPNLVPFFFLLYLYSFYKLTTLKINLSKFLYLWIFSLGVLIQLHASAFILIPANIILLILYRPKNLKWPAYLLSFLIIILLFIPFITYELSSNFENIHKIISVIFNNSENISFFSKLKFNLVGFVALFNVIILANFSGLNNNFSFLENVNIYSFSFLSGLLIFLSTIIISIFHICKNKIKSNFLFILFLILVIFFVCSKKILFLHYYIIFFPLIFILFGFLLSWLYKINIFTKLIAILIILIIAISNLLYIYNYFSGLKNNTWQKYHNIPFFQINKAVNFIVKEAKNDTINLNCEINDYCKSFEYLLDLNNIKINSNSSDKFRIYQSFEIESDFKPIQLEH